ncbi:MAG: T9SS type A sorting domain-containing protein [candidate division WOR-3 bacterium]|nr:MAG: T9SS type A sorting domain-containing protein [candidate division WOR-3 bacterium]
MQICKKIWISVLLCCVLVVMIGLVGVIGSRKHTQLIAEASPQVRHLAQSPMAFIENQGQWPDEVAYLARKGAMSAWLQKDGITFRFDKSSDGDQTQGAVLQLTFEGASEQVLVEGQEKQATKHNFFLGNDRTQWRSSVPSYAKVIYKDLYDGIDLCVREHNGWLEYDLLLSEEASLEDVVICCEGLKDLHIGDDGVLVMDTEFGPITQKLPTAWYELPLGDRLPVACNFRKIDDQRYGFEVENDLGLALVIDPGVEWSTFLGGLDNDVSVSVAIKSSGEIVTVGVTASSDFPTIYGAYDTTYNQGQNDGFISCFNADLTVLLWSTFLGGDDVDALMEVALDNSNNVVVGGFTYSSHFPVTPSAYDTSYNGQFDGIVACISSDGSELIYSTFLGTDTDDMIMSLVLSNTEDAIVCGYTASTDFPTTPGAFDTSYNGGVRDAFITRLSADGDSLVYSTFLGGSSDDGWYYMYPIVENTDYLMLAVDDADNVFIAGGTLSPDFPTTAGAYDTSHNGGWDNFAAKLNAAGSDLIYSTFFGGSAGESPFLNAITITPGGRVAIGGYTHSPDFPTTPNAYDTSFNAGPGDWDAFVSVFSASGHQLIYSTFLGGDAIQEGDVVCALIFDHSGNLVLAGQAESGFPTTSGAYDTIMGGNYDAYIARLYPENNGTDDLVYCSYLGGYFSEMANDFALIDDSTLVAVGRTYSPDFPVTSGAYDTTHNGQWDGFVCQFGAYPVGIEENKTGEPLSSIVLGNVFPNPSYREFNYSINLQRSQEVQISVFDITGRLVEKLIDGQLHAGIHEFSWQPGDNIASGTYFLTLRTGDFSETRKVLLVK